MTRRILRILVEVEGEAFDPDAINPYAETQAELEAVLTSNLQTITSMDAGDIVTLRDTNGNRCGKVEMEDFPGNTSLLPYWTKLSDFALDVEEEFPVSRFLKESLHPLKKLDPETGKVEPAEPQPEKPRPAEESVDAAAAAAFDAGEIAEPSVAGAEAVSPHRTRKSTGNPNVPPPPGDPSLS